MVLCLVIFVFFKQKTAYEMRISDWSSDVCSSDLIVFESDRSGGQQIYTMNIDGSQQRRISFGGGRYATPEWSPRGDLIAFTKMGGGEFRIGIMTPAGGGERLLTNSWQDEAPTWSPNGRVIQFSAPSPGANANRRIGKFHIPGWTFGALPP